LQNGPPKGWKKIGEIVENLGSTLEDSGTIRTTATHESYTLSPLAERVGDTLAS
jgi:hypothetical protein